MSTTRYNHKALIIRELLPPPISRNVSNNSHGNPIPTSLLHQAFAFCGRAFCVCLLVLLPLVSCDREDIPAGRQDDELQVDTTWTGVYDYDFDGNPIDNDMTFPLPEGTQEAGDAGEAV